MTALTISERRELVLAAIERIRAADKTYREVQMDATADTDDRDAASNFRVAAEAEFAWQWQNVAALLEEPLPEPPKQAPDA